MEDILDLNREQLDNVDNEIFFLLKRRLQISKKIAKYKFENGLEIFDRDRENQKFSNYLKKAKGMEINENYITQIFNLIIENSKEIQEKVIFKLQNRENKK